MSIQRKPLLMFLVYSPRLFLTYSYQNRFILYMLFCKLFNLNIVEHISVQVSICYPFNQLHYTIKDIFLKLCGSLMNPPSVLKALSSEPLIPSQRSLMWDGSEKHTDLLFLANTNKQPETSPGQLHLLRQIILLSRAPGSLAVK